MDKLISPAISEIIERSSLERKLKSGRKLRIKLGVDPSAPDLHLGHYIVLKQLKLFADAGHTVIFLIGDYTSLIGDPSGRKTERPVLTDEAVKKNVKTYLDQVSLVLDTKKIEIRYNSEWYKIMKFRRWLEIMGYFSVNQIFERDDFAKRIKQGLPLSMHETAYPMMQAYDSVELKADVELGGTDQRFNLLAGRALQRKMGLPAQDVMMATLLVGTDGKKKMSKSVGNYIALTDSPENMFGKVMSIPDTAVKEYAQLVLGRSIKDLKSMAGSSHPMEMKRELATRIVKLFHPGSEQSARAHFTRVFSEKKLPTAPRKVKVASRVIKDIILAAEPDLSMSALRRQVNQSGVKINGKAIDENSLSKTIDSNDDIISLGKKKYYKRDGK